MSKGNRLDAFSHIVTNVDGMLLRLLRSSVVQKKGAQPCRQRSIKLLSHCVVPIEAVSKVFAPAAICSLLSSVNEQRT